MTDAIWTTPLIWVLTWIFIIGGLVFLIWVTRKSRTEDWAGFFVYWLALSGATGFFLWLVNGSPAELREIQAGLARYAFFLLPGAAIAGTVTLTMRALGARRLLAILCYSSCMVYFGFLKVLGWNLMPWVMVALIAPAFVRLRKTEASAGSTLLLLQCMGTMAGLYMSFHLQDFLGAWEPFKEVVAGLWLMITGFA